MSSSRKPLPLPSARARRRASRRGSKIWGTAVALIARLVPAHGCCHKSEMPSASELLAGPMRLILNYALPPRCPACGVIVEGDRRLCLDCWSQLEFIGPPWCAGCRLPFAYDRGDGALCGRCLAEPPAHDGVLAGIGYGDVARTLVLRLKY